ncbi:MAG TPA: prepilin-type N-terminal cleavage/methylation domain-containing protein [Actinomycetota bacterium]|nr:prepilin-type N-terminal cleavage/methylation domain-containing protein [Actinomycetota bacterium]
MRHTLSTVHKGAVKQNMETGTAQEQERESGFTLIELLIVILIIAVLAAIAIPVYLNQRQRGWGAAAESALQSAVRAEHSFSTESNGLYTTDTSPGGELEQEGYNPSAEVSLIVRTNADGTKFCIQAKHARDDATFDWKLSTFESDIGAAKKDVDTCDTGIYTVGPPNQTA